MPQAPWYVYIIALLVGLPIFILWGVFGWQLVRGVLSWVAEAPPQPQAPKRVAAKG